MTFKPGQQVWVKAYRKTGFNWVQGWEPGIYDHLDECVTKYRHGVVVLSSGKLYSFTDRNILTEDDYITKMLTL